MEGPRKAEPAWSRAQLGLGLRGRADAGCLGKIGVRGIFFFNPSEKLIRKSIVINRGMCVDEVAHINGVINFERAYDYQKRDDDDE